jgi:hypothetical protein
MLGANQGTPRLGWLIMAKRNRTGYGQSPLHSRWRKGKSGNPAGKPQGTRNRASPMSASFNKRRDKGQAVGVPAAGSASAPSCANCSPAAARGLMIAGVPLSAPADGANTSSIVANDHTRLYRLGKWAALRKTSLMRVCQPGPDAR